MVWPFVERYAEPAPLSPPPISRNVKESEPSTSVRRLLSNDCRAR